MTTVRDAIAGRLPGRSRGYSLGPSVDTMHVGTARGSQSEGWGPQGGRGDVNVSSGKSTQVP